MYTCTDCLRLAQVTFLRSQHIVTNEPVTVKIILKKRVGYAECANFYNVLFKKIARILGMVQMSRNYFHPNSAIQLPAEKYPSLRCIYSMR